MKPKKTMKICLGSSCFARGNKLILQTIKAFIVKHNLQDELDFRGSHCFGKCQHGPNLNIDGVYFHNISPENIEEVLRENLLEK